MPKAPNNFNQWKRYCDSLEQLENIYSIGFICVKDSEAVTLQSELSILWLLCVPVPQLTSMDLGILWAAYCDNANTTVWLLKYKIFDWGTK